jgi:predicted ester cyclase
MRVIALHSKVVGNTRLLHRNTMSLERNKAIVLKFYEAFDQKDVERGRELMSADIVGRGMGTDILKGYDAFMQYGMMMFSAFPDGRHLLEEVIAEDDKVATRGIFTGTHQGELMGIPPTGKQVKFSVVHIDRVVDGKIVEHWGQGDIFAMMQQLGVVLV